MNRAHRRPWRLALLLLPLLYLPLRAAEAPDAGVPLPERPADAGAPPAPSQSESTSSTTPSQDAAPARNAPDNDSEADDEDGEGERVPMEQVSADNNLSFPVDI